MRLWTKRPSWSSCSGSTMVAHGDLARRIRNALKRVASLEATRAAIPRRVPVAHVVEGDWPGLT
jgi:hypothetical protein